MGGPQASFSLCLSSPPRNVPWAERRKARTGAGRFLLGYCTCEVETSPSVWLRQCCWICLGGGHFEDPRHYRVCSHGSMNWARHHLPAPSSLFLPRSTPGSPVAQGSLPDSLQPAPCEGIHHCLAGNRRTPLWSHRMLEAWVISTPASTPSAPQALSTPSLTWRPRGLSARKFQGTHF